MSERRLLVGDLEISPNVQIKSYGSAELCKAALAKGYVDCWMADVQPLDRLVARYPGLYRVFADNVMTVDLGVAFDDSYEGPIVKDLNTACLPWTEMARLTVLWAITRQERRRAGKEQIHDK